MKSNVSMLKPAEIRATEKLGNTLQGKKHHHHQQKKNKPRPIHTWLIWEKPSYANFFTSQNTSVGWDFVDITVEELSTNKTHLLQ